MMIKYILFSFTILVSSLWGLKGQAGSLDPTFHNDGILFITQFTQGQSYANSVITQADGKILVLGYINNGVNKIMSIARLNPDGSLDSSFSGDGLLILSQFTNNHSYGHSITIQNDGKIIVAGYVDDGTKDVMALARISPIGNLDSSFGNNGIVFIPQFTNGDSYIQQIALQSDGKIVVAGYIDSGGGKIIAIARLNPNGSLDNSFSTDGLLLVSQFIKDSYGYSVQIQNDGKILVAGYVDEGTRDIMVLARISHSGNLDTSFDGDGLVSIPQFTNQDSYIKSVALQDDGKIIVVGYINSGANEIMAVARLNTNGSLDNSFSTDGLILVDNITLGQSYGNSVKIQDNGKIVIGGYINNGFNEIMVIVRLLVDGTLDSDFDGDGIVIVDKITNGQSYANDLTIQSDGKIVAAGYINNGANEIMTLVRLKGDEVTSSYNDHLSKMVIVYPNPTKNIIQIQGNLSILSHYEIYSSNGEKVLFSKLSGETISISDLANGMYLLRLINQRKGVVLTKKIIKQN